MLGEVMSTNLLNVAMAGLAVFLIGINAAILYRFWPERWLTLKLVASSSLLTYCALSVLYGNPAEWRLLVGTAAICIDAGAIVGIWEALNKARAGDGVLIAYRRR